MRQNHKSVQRTSGHQSNHNQQMAPFRGFFDDGFMSDFFNMDRDFFGGFGLANFGGEARGRGNRQAMMPFSGFDGLLENFNNVRLDGPSFKGNPGKGFACQSYVYSKTIGSDGKPHEQHYYQNNMSGITKEGKRIGQSEEMYKNTGTGVKKMAHQKILGDQARRIVKTKNSDGKRDMT